MNKTTNCVVNNEKINTNELYSMKQADGLLYYIILNRYLEE